MLDYMKVCSAIYLPSDLVEVHYVSHQCVLYGSRLEWLEGTEPGRQVLGLLVLAPGV